MNPYLYAIRLSSMIALASISVVTIITMIFEVWRTSVLILLIPMIVTTIGEWNTLNKTTIGKKSQTPE